MKTAFNFLVELCLNNNRDWFHQNKEKYTEARADIENEVQIVIDNISGWDSKITGQRAKDCIFRIYRDTRFSKDKAPYKTHFGAYIVPGGKNAWQAGYYLHIEPDNSFIGGGIYMPPSPDLLKIRTSIYNNPQAYLSIVESEKFKNKFEMVTDGKLKTAPRGFPKDWEYIDLIRNKHYACGYKISDEVVCSSDRQQLFNETFKEIKPLNDFINDAIQ